MGENIGKHIARKARDGIWRWVAKAERYRAALVSIKYGGYKKNDDKDKCGCEQCIARRALADAPESDKRGESGKRGMI